MKKNEIILVLLIALNVYVLQALLPFTTKYLFTRIILERPLHLLNNLLSFIGLFFCFYCLTVCTDLLFKKELKTKEVHTFARISISLLLLTGLLQLLATL